MDSEQTKTDNSLFTCNSEKVEVMSTMPKRGGKPVKVTLIFSDEPKPRLRETIAKMLIESFVKRRQSE